MKPIIFDFLSLRPMWTRRRLEIVWCIYVGVTLARWGFMFSPLFGFSFFSSLSNVSMYYNPIYGSQVIFHHQLGFYLSLIHTILTELATLALVRIFIEIALTYLAPTSGEEARA